jgi:hypothetical protein
MSRQLAYFGEYQRKLSALVGPARARQMVRRSLVLITLGGNDFVNNYFLVPFSLRSRQFALPDYVRYLVSEYKKILIVRCPPILFVCRFYISRALFRHDLSPTRSNRPRVHGRRGCTPWAVVVCW